jgi:hypothetical protein
MNPDAIKNMQRQFDAAKNLGLSNKRFFDQAEAMKRNLFNPAIDVNRNLPTVRMARLMDAAGVESLSKSIGSGHLSKAIEDAARAGAGLNGAQLAAGKWSELARNLYGSINEAKIAESYVSQMRDSLERSRGVLAAFQYQPPHTAWAPLFQGVMRQRETMLKTFGSRIAAQPDFGALARSLTAPMLRDFTLGISKQLAVPSIRTAVGNRYDLQTVFEGLATIDAYADEVEDNVPDVVEPEQRRLPSSQQILAMIVVISYIIAFAHISYKVEDMGLDASAWRNPENLIELAHGGLPILIDLYRWKVKQEKKDDQDCS